MRSLVVNCVAIVKCELTIPFTLNSTLHVLYSYNVFTGEVGQPLEVGHVVTTDPTQNEVSQTLVSTK